MTRIGWRPSPRLLGLVLAATTLLLFWPVSGYDFSHYDDSEYFSSNWQVLAGLTPHGVAWAFQPGYAANWHPLTWLSLMLDAQVFGAGASGPHITNLLFHVANTLLLFAWLRRITGALWCSAGVAALFALHPLHVESVAWVSERKDVLSTFFFLLTLLAYGNYAAHPEERQRQTHPARTTAPANSRSGRQLALWYALSLLCFALGLMSKPMVVTLPFVLLLLDYWPLRRLAPAQVNPCPAMPPLPGQLTTWRRLLLEKWPFFLLSAVSCAVTLVAQGKAVQPLTRLPLGARCENALVAYTRYLGKALWPTNLAVLYPHPGHWPWGRVALAAVLLGLICLLVLWRARPFPFLVVGWFWFLGTLVPVIGLVQVGMQAMADRYSYIPLIGLFILVVWSARELCARYRLPATLAGASSLVLLAACAWQTHNQLQSWQDGETLLSHAVAATANNPLVVALWKGELGSRSYRQGNFDEALLNYRQAVELDPQSELAQNNLGLALAAKGQFNQAIACYRQALELEPGYVNACVNLGDALRATGHLDAAMEQYGRALHLDPHSLAALNDLAAACLSKGRPAEAETYYRRAIQWAPTYAGAYRGLGKALALQGRLSEAVTNYLAALRLDPNNPEAHYLLGMVLLQDGNAAQAEEQLREALRLRPDYPDAVRALQTATNALERAKD